VSVTTCTNSVPISPQAAGAARDASVTLTLMRRWTLAPAAAALVLCPSAGATAATGGLHGLVTRGPTAPVCRVGVSCTAPAAHATLVFSLAGHEATRARTDAKGRYRVTLAPGSYAVRTPRRFGLRIGPTRVVVRAGVMRRTDFAIDTGIR
jgi:hypothetical protein